MSRRSSRPEVARADRVLPGLWRLRLPLPWPATPHGNAYAIQAGDGIVLFDTGYGGPDGLRQLELGLAQAGFRLEDISLIVCTHAHADHFGAAASIIARTGVPIWIHPAWEHARRWCEGCSLSVSPSRTMHRTTSCRIRRRFALLRRKPRAAGS